MNDRIPAFNRKADRHGVLRDMDEAPLLHKRTFEHSIQQHGEKRIRKLLKCIA